MKDMNRPDDWRSLCELASKEKDPQKLLDLVSRISRALEEPNRQKQEQELPVRIDAALLATLAPRNDFDFYSFPGRPSLAVAYEQQVLEDRKC